MFTADLFITAKIRKQPRCPSGGAWINCGISRHWTVIQHSKEMTWRKLKCILLRERNQSEKATDSVIQLYDILEEAKWRMQLAD